MFHYYWHKVQAKWNLWIFPYQAAKEQFFSFNISTQKKKEKKKKKTIIPQF